MQHSREKHIRLFKQLLEDSYGIHVTEEKTDMLKVKLEKLMTRCNINSFDEYYGLVSSGGPYLTQFLDEITTHTTNFFRGNSHFEFITRNMGGMLNKNKRIEANGEIRAWSAACSTGEEAYTLAMVLSEILPEEIDIKILATDISRKAVSRAVRGEYAPEIAGEVEKCYIQKYFTRGDGTYQVAARIRDLVTFRIFNLMEPFSFRRDFDLILCRNVMIYFDKETQKRLVQKMYDVLAPGGLFFIGHSEGLVHKEHKFRFIQPSVYVK